jgi:hypothetical protein
MAPPACWLLQLVSANPSNVSSSVACAWYPPLSRMAPAALEAIGADQFGRRADPPSVPSRPPSAAVIGRGATWLRMRGATRRSGKVRGARGADWMADGDATIVGSRKRRPMQRFETSDAS